MDTGLSDMGVAITGASGGIGRALTRAFYDEGARLALHANANLEGLEGFVVEAGLDRDRVHCGRADVKDEAAVQGFFDGAASALGRLDVCIVNAGIWPAPDEPLHEMSASRVREVLEVNLLGAMWTIRAFMRGLAATGPRDDGRGASLCLIGSTAARFGEAGHAPYSVTKSAMYGLLRSVKNEITHLDPYGRINLVEPGWTVTEMARSTVETPGVIERVCQTMAVRQLARPEDIAHSVVFLSAPALARHVSGEVVTVAGGMEGRSLWRPEQVDADEVRRRLDAD